MKMLQVVEFEDGLMSFTVLFHGINVGIKVTVALGDIY
jgi:hypothetical protein